MIKFETKDEFIKGITAGSVGAIAMYLFVESLRWLNIIKYGQSYLAGDAVFAFKPTLFMNFIGFIETIVLGVFFGIILTFFFSRYLTSHYYLLKGLLFGVALWILNLGLIDELFRYPADFHKSATNLIAFLIGYVIYGTVTAYILKKLGIFKTAR